jgi:hypothetical protein
MDSKKLIGVTIDTNARKWDTPIKETECDEALAFLKKHGLLQIYQCLNWLPYIHFTGYTFGCKNLGITLEEYLK